MTLLIQTHSSTEWSAVHDGVPWSGAWSCTHPTLEQLPDAPVLQKNQQWSQNKGADDSFVAIQWATERRVWGRKPWTASPWAWAIWHSEAQSNGRGPTHKAATVMVSARTLGLSHTWYGRCVVWWNLVYLTVSSRKIKSNWDEDIWTQVDKSLPYSLSRRGHYIRWIRGSMAWPNETLSHPTKVWRINFVKTIE